MNKFLLIALFACVASAVAVPAPEINDEASELALFDTDEAETAGLKGDKVIFADFCVSIRDYVKQYLRDQVNSGTARVFNLMVDTVAQVSHAIGENQKNVVEQGSKAVSQDALEIKNAFINVLKALTGTGQEQLMQVFDQLKEQLTSENLRDIADESCLAVSMVLKPSMEKKLTAYKNTMLAEAGGDKYKDMFKSTRIENVGCLTTGRVSKVASGCNMIRIVAPSVMEFMGV